MTKLFNLNNVEISNFCGDYNCLFDEFLINKVSEYFKDATEPIHINIKVEPFKSISKECEKIFEENTIEWDTWYIIKKDKEHLFPEEELCPLQEAVKSFLVNKFAEYGSVDIISQYFLFDDYDFNNVKTIADLEELTKKYSKTLSDKNNYKDMINILTKSINTYCAYSV